MRGWYLALVAVVWISAIVHSHDEEPEKAGEEPDEEPDAGNPLTDKLDLAGKAIGVVDQGVDVVTKIDGILQGKLDSHFDAVKEAPPHLIDSEAVGEIAKNMKPGSDIEFKELSGFDGISEYRPPGWKIEAHTDEPEEEPEGEEDQDVFGYPMGIGALLMSGCFGTGYKENDPCYQLAIPLDRCVDQLDAANFIGVGFDVTGSYTSESRKKSVVQRTCYNQAKFADGDVPDNMNAFGIYDYKIGTKSFQSVDGYRAYLAKKSGTSMSAGTFAEISDKFETASSYGSAGLFWNAGGGTGSGSSQSKQFGSQFSNSLGQQASSDSEGTSNSFMAVLEAEIIMYEIALDSSGPGDLSQPFLKDYFKLPTSYYHIGADVKLQDFILRYGTHYVKSAKFGGKLNIFKKVAKDSKMSSDEFAKESESEFSAMMSTLRNSYKQSHAKVGFWGFGGQHSSKAQSAAAQKTERTQNQRSENNRGRQSSKTSESIETTVEALGGKPEIAAAIMDFYTPAFRSQFIEWLGTISDYPKPFDMTFGRISELFNINVDELFNEGQPEAGCLNKHLEKAPDGREYFIQTTTTKIGNKTVATKKKVFCGDFGRNQKQFANDFKAKRLALERALTIYMSEGPFSTSSFDLPAGKKGCEMETLEFVTNSLTAAKSWPDYTSMKKSEFKVVFRLPRPLPGILPTDQEFIVKYHTGDWYFKLPGSHYSIDNSCQNPHGSLDKDHRICVAGMILQYFPDKGLFKFDQRHYEKQHTDVAKLTRSFGNHYIATCEPNNVLTNLEKDKLGQVPCNVKWTNSHRIDPNTNTSCIHFSAASEGDLFILFSAVPKDHSTWYYLQLSPTGVAYYQQMILRKRDVGKSIGTLGDKALFETFFVCLMQPAGKNLRINYGKAASEREVGVTLSTHEFQHSNKEQLSFYSFGSGEDEVTIDDVRVIKARPSVLCGAGLVKVKTEAGELCMLECHTECWDRCFEPKDPKACKDRCKNVKHFYNKDDKENFICLHDCPSGYERVHNKKKNWICVPCNEGYSRAACTRISKKYEEYGNSEFDTCCHFPFKDNGGSHQKCIKKSFRVKELGKSVTRELGWCGTTANGDMLKGGHGGVCVYDSGMCEPCYRGTFANRKAMSKCINCEAGTYQDKWGMTSCKKCPKGQYQPKKGQQRCILCEPGSYQDKEGQTNSKLCRPGTHNNKLGQSKCKMCLKGYHQPSEGKRFCTSCKPGSYQDHEGKASCSPCEKGYYQTKAGASKCYKCLEGYFAARTGQRVCDMCPAGTYQDQLASSTCKPCQPGQECPRKGLKQPIACPKNTYSDTEYATRCKKCPVNKSSPPNSASCESNCKPGTYVDGITCKPCAGGSISKSNGALKCTPCQKGFTSDYRKTACIDIDECANTYGKRCNYRGKCVNSMGSYKCKCTHRGYTGIHCDQDVDECKTPSSCKNGGKCTNTKGGYRCTCSKGWDNFRCQSDIDECATGGLCGRYNGRCINTDGSYTCKCNAGWSGKNCENAVKVVKECSKRNPCHHGGTCINKPGGYTCSCKTGYTGRHCLEDVDECKKKDACNGGKCKNLRGDYKCTCTPEYTGLHCDKDVNECLKKDACQNGGTCRNTHGGYSCSCKPGYDGTRCEKVLDVCKIKGFCQHNCNNKKCSCKTGYKLLADGKTCDDINECNENGCSVHSQCQNTPGSFSCKCNDGYTQRKSPNGKNRCQKIHFILGEAGKTFCPRGYRLVTSQSMCQIEAKKFFNKRLDATGCWLFAKKGCVDKGNAIVFNTCTKHVTTRKTYKPICEPEGEVPWRNDGRCGKKHLNAAGKPGECDPTKNANEEGPCCSSGGYCGNSHNHCKCSGCIDFRSKSG